MKAILIAAALMLPSVAYANSGTRHDQRLEQAAADIVASKMGEIRGGFRHDEQPVFVVGAEHSNSEALSYGRDPEMTGSIWKDGLAPARGIPAYRRGNI